MADFFNSMDDEQVKEKNNKLSELQNDYFFKNKETVNQVLAQRDFNRKLYGIQVPDAMYEELNKSILASDNPQEEAHRTGTALKYMQMFNIPYSEAYTNRETYSQILWDNGSKISAKDEYTRVSDAFALGVNGIKIGVLGNRLMQAQKNGEEDKVKALLEEYEALKADNEARANSTPDKWWKEAIEGGAQSLPYTGFAALAGTFGNFIAPLAGELAAFGTSSFLMAGEEYMDMLDQGIRPEIARPAASVSGMIQGAVEASLGKVASWVGSGAAVAGKKVISKPLQEKLADTLATKLQKKFHFGAARKIAVKEITRYLSDLPEEGAEEGLQSLLSSGVSYAAVKLENTFRNKERSEKENEATAELAAGNITDAVFKDIISELENEFREIPTESLSEIIKDAKEEFRGGVLVALVLGLPPAAGYSYASSRDLHKIKKIMEETPSQELAEKIIKETVDENGQSLYDKVFSGYSDKEKDNIIDDLFKSQQAIAERKENLKAKEYAEVNATPEGYKEDKVVTDENGNPVTDEETNDVLMKRDPVYRNENGELETENETITEKDDTAEKVYKAYDPNTEGNNLLAHIRYNVDEKNNAITITEFNTGNNSGIAQEFYDKWARENAAGYEVTWNAIGENAQQVKEDLINNNPSGINNGLNYYSSVDEVADIKARTDAIKKIDEAYKAVGKKLNKEQLQSHVSIVEAMFKSLKRHGDIKQNTFNEFINFVFGDEMFGDASEITYPGAKGKSRVKTVKELEQGIKAAIYVTENGDYSTFVHEMAHVYRKLVSNEHIAEISKAFNVKQNENGEYNWTRLDEENFAYSFEDYLKTGKAANEQQKTIFEKIADFLREAYQGLKSVIQITSEISKVFDEMLDMDDSVIANSQRAADEYERNENNKKTAARQEELRKQQQKQEAQEKEKTKENIDISQEKITANEQDFPLSENEEAEIKSEKFAEEQIENDIREIFDELKPAQEELDELVDKLTNGTQQEKIETAMDAAGEAYFADLENQVSEKPEEIRLTDENPEELYQLVGELGATNMDRAEEVTTRIDNKNIAVQMEQAGKDAKTIKLATGWEKGVDGKWRYETNDLLNKFDLINKVLDFEKRNPKYKEYSDKLWASYDGGPELTEAEIQEFDALSDEANAYYDKKDVKLKDILDAPELYAAYPQLKEMDVKFVNDPLNTTRASYAIGRDLWTDAEVDFIQINNIPNSINEKEYESVLLHEIQHAIQRIEGFATGGSVQELVQNYKSRIHARMNEAYREYYSNDELKKDYDEYKRLFNKVAEASSDDFMAAYDELFKFEDSHENVRNFNKELEQARKDLHLENNMEAAPLFNGRITDTYYDREYSEIVKTLAEDYYNISAFDDYKALAGEVEARNVQKRMNMSPAERLKTLLSETEDVARDQQIVMYEAVRMAAAEEKQLEQTEVEKQIEAVRKQYKGTDQWMKAPNDEKTNLTLKQWLTVRTPNFKRWFGNWELGNKLFNIVQLEKAEFNTKERAVEWAINNKITGLMTDEETNGKGKINISNRSIDEMLNAAQRIKSVSNDVHYAVLTKIRDIIKESEIVDSHPDFLKGKDGKRSPINGINKDVNIDILYGAISYEETIYRVKTTVKRYIDINENDKAYAYSVENIEVLPGTLANTENSTIPKGNTSTSGNILLQGVYKVNKETGENGELVLNDYSKVLDENGEPLVVYHGTDQDFSVFDASKSRANMDIQGNFFSPWELDAQGYGPNVRAFFLNIRNPANEQTGYKALHTFTGQNEAGKKARELLKSQGYDGVNNNNEEYIAFNPNQIKSATDNNGNFDENIDDIFYQTEQELLSDAMKYERWEDFMEAYQNDFDPVALEDPLYHSQVPEGADAQWYQTTWEVAHNIMPEESLNEKEIFDIVSSDTTDAAALDALFTSRMDNNENMLNEFLLRVAEIVSINLNDEEFSHIADEEEQQQINRIVELQDFISTQLAHGNWVSNAKRLRKGEELTESKRKAILTLMREMPRDYRAIYAEIMDDPKWAVDEKDSVSTKLRERAKLTKYKAASLDTDFERLSPEKRRQIAEQMDDEDIARQVREGTLHLDDRIENYIRNKDKKIREVQKTLENLEKEKNEDYQRIADAQKRELLNLNEKLQLAKLKLEKNDRETKRLIEKGQKISGKYMLNSQNLRADYNEIFRKFSDLKAVIKIDAQVEEAIKRQNMIFATRSKLQNEQKQRSLANEVKQMRIQLVKRAMRRVPFNRIDYENARTIIAIQRMLEPNLLGGVNRFIGQDSPFLRGVISGIITDADYKEKIVAYLKKTARASEANREFIEKIENLKTIEQFETWTKKERDYAIKKLPKENWIRDLNLIKLAEEREESIDLDISMKEKQRAAIDENTGDIKTDKEGNIITETTFELSYSDEIGQLVKDAIGADMFNRLINVPFAEWTEKDLEKLATVINNLYKEGRDLLDAKKALKKLEADRIRMAIEEAVKNTGIVINDDDTPEEKQRKKEKIAKILGYNSAMKGTVENSYNKESNINRILHGYTDANVRRVARILDNYSEGTNTTELYWKENEAYNNKTRSINNRVNAINNVLKENNITIDELNKELKQGDNTFTVDELLYILAADKDFAAKEDKTGSELIDDNDDYAATSRNAVMFGNMLSGTDFLEMKESLYQQDKDLNDRINNDELTEEEQQLLVTGQLITNPGTKQYIEIAHARYENVLAFARNFVKENTKYEALLDVIAADYASQYDRMNQISIEEFNSPVHRVAAYVPLVRLESNGDTNANQVQNDLLATMGGQSKNWVNKGMTQRRVNMSPLNQKPVEMGLYKTWSKSVERTEHFIAYAPYVRELNRVYKSRDAQFTRQFIEGRYGKGMLTYIDDYINEVANPNANKVRNNADAIIRALRGKTAPAYLAWKASSIMKQAATSPWPYMQFVDPVTYLNACFKCMLPGTYEAIRSKSVFMNNRRFDPLADLVDELGENPKNKFESFMAKQSVLGMQGLEWIDWVAVAPGWLACYEKKYAELENKAQARYEAAKARLMEENLYADIGTTEYKTTEQIEAIAKKESEIDTEKEAIDYADDCVRLCQPSNRSVDIAPLFKSSSEFQKAYLQFQTSLNVIWQNIRYDIPYAVRQKEFKQVAGIILGYVFAGIAMNSLMEGATAGDDDDKDTIETLRKQVYNATTQFTDSVPLLGSAITAANQKIITGKGGYTTSGEDMTPMVTKFINVVTRSAKAINETDEEKRNKAWIKAAESFGEGVGMYLGLPVQGTKEILKVAGVGDDDGKPGLKLSEIADNELFNAIDELNPINEGN